MRKFPLIREVCSGATRRQSTDGQLFGIEIEMEGAGDYIDRQAHEDLPTGWRMTHDGSLRNNGVEFISTPVTREEALRLLPRLYAQVQEELHSSVRCGIHVHVDMRERTTDQLAPVFATYALVEPILFNYCGLSREENIYCVPWYRAYDEPVTLANAIAKPGHWHLFNEACKYSALYAGPIISFGTIEFRMAPTWMDAERVITWVNIIDDLVAYGKAHTAEEVLDAFYTDEARFLRDVFMNTHQIVCQDMEEAIGWMYQFDTPGVAETFVPPCTYKVNWNVPSITVEGTGTDGYAHSVRMDMHGQRARMDVFEESREEPQFPEDYDEFPEDEQEEDE